MRRRYSVNIFWKVFLTLLMTFVVMISMVCIFAAAKWMFLLGFPVKGIAAIRNEIMAYMGTVTVFAILAAGGILYFIVTRLTVPVNDFITATGEMGKGNFAYRMKAASGDEIGQLVRAFNGMAEKLQSSTTSIIFLNKEIEERKRSEMDKEALLKKVEDVNRKKTEFVSDVSHELRTPLASIKGFVSTIRAEKEMEEATKEEFLKIVEEESDRLTRIIEDLLDLSRIESGRLKLNPKPVELNEVIHKNIEGLKMQAKARSVEIEEALPSRTFVVYADQDKTVQVIINLLSNAIKYNKEGGKVKVSASEEDGKVRVDIEDTGMGISDKDLPHMFEKFYRVERSSHETPGTGLGLAVTKSLVEVMGGEIKVQSRPGEGSKFSFSLPKADARQKELVCERS